MKTLVAHAGAPGLGRTERRDSWWVEPSLVAVGLAIFIVYSTWAALVGTDYASGPYLSPFYSPYFKPSWWPFSASLFVLWIPLGFRLTCYYYRKAYYRAFFLSPPACSVSEPKREYTGETGIILRWWPVLHRWFLYLSIVILILLWSDTVRAFDFSGRFGIGVGSLVMLANVALLSAFTLGCHALRSLVGGNVKCYSCSPGGQTRYGAWRFVSFFTGMHPWMAWFSLYSVGLCDLYIRLCSMGVISDPRIL
ncbi:MAG: succinate dehydrogenase [Candidatus Baltobacteraceae bacterium]